MELWQRLKDLEKKVQEQGASLVDLATRIVAPQVQSVDGATRSVNVTTPSVAAIRTIEVPMAVQIDDKELIAGLEEEKRVGSGHALCVKCRKVPGYYFHTKHCKGNAEVA
jgi:hypothetical protein